MRIRCHRGGIWCRHGCREALQIKSDSSGVLPDCIVLNVTVRSMKLHGGAFGAKGSRRPTSEELATENVEATSIGASTNLARHLTNLTSTGIPVVVSINRFSTDTDRELPQSKTSPWQAAPGKLCFLKGMGRVAKARLNWLDQFWSRLKAMSLQEALQSTGPTRREHSGKNLDDWDRTLWG